MSSQSTLSLLTKSFIKIQSTSSNTISKPTAQNSSNWTPPPPCVLKINVDCSFISENAPISIGYVIRDNNACSVARGITTSKITTAEHRECWGVFHVATWAYYLGCTHIMIETDHQDVAIFFCGLKHNLGWVSVNILVESSNQENIPSIEEINTIETIDSSISKDDNGGSSSSSRDLAKWAKSCNLYDGKWVRDEEYPKYQPSSCPYVDEGFSCQANGRPDSEYLNWRWKPNGCDIPRFNATDFLERLKGRRLMLVGDSMNRNQFESILCLLRQGLTDKTRMYETHGYKITKGRGYFVFKFEDYNCTVEFVRSHFLVREGTRVNGQGNSNPTLSIDRIDKTARRWLQADILVFNTGHWWTHGKTSRGKNYYMEGETLYPHFDATEAYTRAIKTWAKWIDANIDPSQKLVFYRGYSSAHYRGGDWDSGGTCNGEKEPIFRDEYANGYPPKMKIVEEVIRGMKVPVILLNVTKLTNFRKDGHPSVYGKNVTGLVKVSTKRQDCSHWCLPGVPDAWNELIYMNLIIQQATL